MVRGMESPSSIIRALGGPSKVAAALGISNPSTVAKWCARESIPGRYWWRMAAHAESCAVPNITVDAIAASHAERAT